jgi:hypothetical protein
MLAVFSVIPSALAPNLVIDNESFLKLACLTVKGTFRVCAPATAEKQRSKRLRRSLFCFIYIMQPLAVKDGFAIFVW